MIDVLVVGSGGREHAIAWKLLASRQVGDVYVAPGNAGTGLIARNVALDPLDANAVIQAAVMRGVRLVVVGPEAPLAQGLIDELSKLNIAAFGPTKAAAEIEWSKVFAKDLMHRHKIPTAKSQVFTSLGQAREFLGRLTPPVVVKADGLAAGKGVTVAPTLEEADRALVDCLERDLFGSAGRRVLIEEYLEGPEVSLLAFTDGRTVVPMVPATDYKRAFDQDQGPNTGGMGAYSPPAFATPEIIERATREILEPTVAALAAEGRPYRGVLYAGLMLTADGPKALEFNCRFGDPETQVILPRLESDLLEIMLACVEGRLDQVNVTWRPEAAVGVVMASQGYPGSYQSGHLIAGLDALDDGVLVFHSGTEQVPRAPKPPRFGRSMYSRVFDRGDIFEDIRTAGGRVLTVVGRGPTVAAARELVYRNVPKIQFAGSRYRTDIAAREAGAPREFPDQVPAVDPVTTVDEQLPDPPEGARREIEQAEASIAGGRPAEAVSRLAAALLRYPDEARVRATLATAHAAGGDLVQARAQWMAVIAKHPHSAEAFHNLGVICLHQGEVNAALGYIRESLRLNPKYAVAHTTLGAIAARQGDAPAAIAHYEEALRLDPSAILARIDLAGVLGGAGQRERAIEELERCLADDPPPDLRREIDQQLGRLRRRRWF